MEIIIMKSIFKILMEELQKTNMGSIMNTKKITVKDLAQFLYREGFKGESRFSTEDMRIFVSEDSDYMIVISGSLGKVYSTRNQKKPLHVFGIVKQ